MGGWITIFNRTGESLRRQLDALSRLSMQASSGSRFTKASESPAEAARILQLQAQDRRNESCLQNLQTLSDALEQSTEVFHEISNMLIRGRELATQAATGSYGQDERTSMGQEIDGLIEQAVYLANTRTSGQYYFGGGNSFAEPFVAERSGGRITAVWYRGGGDETAVEVAPGVTYPAQIVGSAAFGNDNRQAPQFLGGTGLAAGSGTSSVEGPQYVQVSHGTTTYAGGSGAAPGASSALLDTALGAHTLTVNMAAKTIQLDGGPVQSFAGSAGLADLAVANAAGDKVYVDLTGVGAAFSGSIALSSTARLSVDDGATSTELLPGQTNLGLIDSRSGRVLFVNTAGLARTGVEPVRVRGTGSVFQALIDLRDLLLNTRKLDSNRQLQLLSQSAATLDEANSTVISQSAMAGGRLQSLDSLADSVTSLRNHIEDEQAGLQNVDIAQVSIELARMQTLYQMTLQSASKIFSLTLLDFLR